MTEEEITANWIKNNSHLTYDDLQVQSYQLKAMDGSPSKYWAAKVLSSGGSTVMISEGVGKKDALNYLCYLVRRRYPK